ncbi:hypothetical protein J2752_001848 [Halarchaeum rubridurum]|uniref:Uncharacterized protein n=1 Tax=Halarchaeum rubridurum TaxID=489911 RepID=A0A8T4GMT0_9EURY|nr:hypothetical protein [Halarchaeum rubridurum]MBP1954936.1 hypothetical protein [Halarchaeum rubridurum]
MSEPDVGVVCRVALDTGVCEACGAGANVRWRTERGWYCADCTDW